MIMLLTKNPLVEFGLNLGMNEHKLTSKLLFLSCFFFFFYLKPPIYRRLDLRESFVLFILQLARMGIAGMVAVT